FNLNLVNRMWSIMMGRGLVHPLDVAHSSNPSVQSQLLAMLADELVRMNFDAKMFLRELALSRTYQRSSEAISPGIVKLDATAAAQVIASWNAEAQRLAAALPALKEGAAQASAALADVQARYSQAAAAHDAAHKARSDAKKASDDAAAALAASIKDVAAKEE